MHRLQFIIVVGVFEGELQDDSRSTSVMKSDIKPCQSLVKGMAYRIFPAPFTDQILGVNRTLLQGVLLNVDFGSGFGIHEWIRERDESAHDGRQVAEIGFV
jgi:hypothetical protein